MALFGDAVFGALTKNNMFDGMVVVDSRLGDIFAFIFVVFSWKKRGVAPKGPYHLPIAPQEIMASEIYKEFEAKLREFLCLCVGCCRCCCCCWWYEYGYVCMCVNVHM